MFFLKFGKQKKLDAALTMYCELITSGIWPTVYTLTGIINACVRCSELSRAQQYLQDMKSIGILPNEVTYTVLIKGFCQEGLIEEAFLLLNTMKLEEISPNLRTFNTILRGCLRNGKLSQAREIFNEIQLNKIEPDVTTYEYFIRSLCQDLQVKEAWGLTKEVVKKGVFQPSIFSAISTSAALKAMFKIAEKAKNLAVEGIKGNSVKSFAAKNRASVSLFNEMKKEEIESECKRVEEYIKSIFNFFFSSEEKNRIFH